MASHDSDQDFLLLFEQQKALACKLIEKKILKGEKRVEERKKILASCTSWPIVYHEGLLLQANLFRISKGMKEIVVSDWEQEGAEKTLLLDPLIPPKNQVATHFRRSKKLRLGVPHAERLLLLAEKELAEFFTQKQALDAVVDNESLASFNAIYSSPSNSLQKKPIAQKKKTIKPYHIFVTEAGVEVWVGKSAKDNDKLTFHCANGLDWWMHANNYPGSHVVIRCPKGVEIDEHSLNDAAELALRYSKAKDCSQGEVCLVQVKALTRVKGVPGKVMISKPKILRITLDSQRWQRLRDNKRF